MYADTITLFNRKSGTAGDTWYPTVIKNVYLNVDQASIQAKYGDKSQDRAVLHIRYTQDGKNVMVAGKPWMQPKAWDGTESTLTFTSGNQFDFFWEGEWDGGVVTDAAYTDGFFEYMNRRHDHVFVVSAVARYSVIPHFEIMGK